MQTFTVRPSEPLSIAFDPAARLAQIGPRGTIKGMFMVRLTSALGSDWRTQVPDLVAPPRLGAYVPFTDYPLVDYARLVIAAARKRYPREPLAEAIRLLERGSVTAFAESTVGRVLLKMAPDAQSALLKIPEAQRMVMGGGGRSTATPEGPRAVRIEFSDVVTWVDCAVVGTLEGAMQLLGESSEIEVTVHSPRHVVLVVNW